MGAAPRRRVCIHGLREGPKPDQSFMPEHRFRFLNVEREVRDKQDWNNPQWEALWLYNLHYFDDLRAKGYEGRRSYQQRILARWILENPPGMGVGWDPYPTSIRIANWVRWGLRGGDLSTESLHSLAIQIRWLEKRLEYHLLGNHLLVNAKALIIGGWFFEGGEADRWRDLGSRILRTEVERQILADGGHCERSPMYHKLILEDLLDIVNLLKVYDAEVFDWLWDAIRKMLRWSAIMRHPDGDIPFFNDAAFNVAAPHEELERYASALGVHSYTRDARESVLLGASGFARLAVGDAVLLADVGAAGPPYQPGHAHAEALSFEFSLFNQRLLVNSGTSTYAAGSTRSAERSTAAHNALSIDGQNSSEVWASFRVGRRAKVSNVELSMNSESRLVAAHDGYRYLAGKPIHYRSWNLNADSLEIVDFVEGSGEHEIEIYLHFHPQASLIEQPEKGRAELSVRMAHANIRCMLDHRCSWRIESGTFSAEFGVQQPKSVLIGIYKGMLPVRVGIQLQWK